MRRILEQMMEGSEVIQGYQDEKARTSESKCKTYHTGYFVAAKGSMHCKE